MANLETNFTSVTEDGEGQRNRNFHRFLVGEVLFVEYNALTILT